MFSVVVITKDQPEYIPEFEEVLHDYNHVYVIDRPTVEYPINIPCIVNYYGEGFLAGRMRDMGASCFYDSDILFLDGDKVPQGDLKSLDAIPYDCVLLGTKNDKRDFFDGTTHLIELDDPYMQYNGVYSCGILLRKNLISRLRELNNGRIFNPVFNGRWGEEDTWNGDIMFHEKFTVGCTSDVVLSGIVEGINGDNEWKNTDLAINFLKRLQLREQFLDMYND